MSEIGSTLARRALGRELRRMRTAKGLTLAEVGRAAETSPQSISRTEDGLSTRVTRLQMNALCDLFGATDAERRMMLGLVDEIRKAHKSKQGGWWRGYADEIHYDFDHYLALEDAAKRLITWKVTTLQGLLQTPSYRRALAWAESPTAPPEQIEKRIEWATRRQSLLENKRLEIDVILSEAVIRNQIGGAAVMHEQLQHLVNVMALPNVSIRVVTFDKPSHLGLLSGSFVLLEFPPLPQSKMMEPPVVYVEEYAGDLFLEREADVQRYRNALQDISRVALDQSKTRRLILDVAKEYAA